MTKSRLKDKTHITVLGAGVSGLTTAIVLLENGYSVKIISKQLPKQTTSAVAAAIWFPYEAYPAHKVSVWSKNSLLQYRRLSQDDSSGVSFIPFTAYLNTDEQPWWLDALPSENILDRKVSSPIDPNHRGFKLFVPLIETPIYLDYLVNRFKESGGEILQQEISSIEELDEYPLVVNCLGLGAKHLFDDHLLFPIQGQVVKVEPSAEIEGSATEYPLGKNGDEMAYIIPRRDGIILGGSAKKHQSSTKTDDSLTNRIIHYCSEFEPKVAKLSVLETKVGLRPGRSEIRLEKDATLPVVHNYGHGGAGYTVSWGCAEEVLKLL
ncbi:FAD-dependent oxidoreductase [Gracilimonas sp.]|uniref:FAD-dependent oxidoreductase n=1 Tax=Gracilimonas sp. TaxID=1974203 RepID=UPI0032EBE924